MRCRRPPRGSCQMWGKYCAFSEGVREKQRKRERERERRLLFSDAVVSVDFSCLSILTKGPLQTTSRQGCHLLANMLSVIFCALGLPSRAGPHGSPAHANRTNPSRTCLSVSLSSISLSPPLSPPFPHPTSFLHVRSTVRQPVLSPRSLIYFTLCPLISPSLSISLTVPEDSAGAVCRLTVAGLCSLCVSLCAR